MWLRLQACVVSFKADFVKIRDTLKPAVSLDNLALLTPYALHLTTNLLLRVALNELERSALH